jgi:cyclic beta-1,2-glucan synthetase
MGSRWFRRKHVQPSTPLAELPPRAELFSVAQLQQHARTLAGWHQLAPPGHDRDNMLLARLAANEDALREAYELIADVVKRAQKITPAAEWFLDNYHLVEEQIRTARLHLPRGYSRELPRLAHAPASGTPRVYDLADELISHSHGRVDRGRLTAFIQPYQEIQPLCVGELWAIPIMLRLALLENLRRVVANISDGRRERERAIVWSDRLVALGNEDPSRVVLVLAELVREDVRLSEPFISELASRLRGQGVGLAFATAWLEQWLTDHGQTLEHVLARVSQDQASAQVAISNSIGSLRALGAIDWQDFVEEVSALERELLADPSHTYAKMDFATRDRYRHVVEAISRHSARSEPEVARLAIELARASAPPDDHVGVFLIGAKRHLLEHAAGVSRSFRILRARPGRGWRLLIYLGTIALITALATWAAAPMLAPGLDRGAVIAALLLLALCSSQLAIALVHWAVTLWVSPSLLPRLDFSGGLPPDQRTLVAVPCMLGDERDIDEQLEALEVRFLANRDPNLHFALLTDFRDSPSERTDTDAVLLQHMVAGIEALNRAHAEAGAPFLLFHRARRHNPREGVWMGWERKRGKLEQLNDALRGDAGGFDTIVGELDRLQDVHYVIVLDADTQLPRDSARLLAATLAHPLNRPRFDAKRGRVVDGYAILQPRVGVTMESAAQSRFAALFGSEPGIDPYTRAVSDVYQDLFDEGSFVGKGIYDVDAMRLAVGGCLPENRVLSHDLLEGSYCRAGLVSDVMLFEDHPAAYAVDVSRRHRWMRGDWQITPWLGWRVPAALARGAARVANPIDLLSKWKIFDNLRRSLVPVAAVALLVVAWMLGRSAGFVTLAVVLIAVVPGLLSAAAALVRRPSELGWGKHTTMVLAAMARQLVRELIGLASLPHDAWLGIDAIARTLWRVMISRRRLLQWRTASDAQRNARSGLLASYVASWSAPTLALAVTGVLAWRTPQMLLIAGPMLLAWLGAPALTWWLSRPTRRRPIALSQRARLFLAVLARRTWHFFATYVAAEDNFLPPDNFQEDPPRGIAHRTSPTNIGLSLTASLAAYDFGYLDVAELIARTTRTFAAMDRLERHRGHFYNWYDTTTLQPLAPLYISTVDSGNLSAHLITLAVGLEQIAGDAIVRPQLFEGLAATLEVIADAPLGAVTPEPLRAALEQLRAALADELREPARTLTGVRARLRGLQSLGEQLAAAAVEVQRPVLSAWTESWTREHAAALAELDHVAPWTTTLADASQPIDAAAEHDEIVSWHQLAHGGAEAMPAGPLRDALALGAARARERISGLVALAGRARALAEAEYGFLYDRERRLLSIGFSLSEHRLDASFYDLLASEARLASYLAIAHGQLPQEH